MKSVSKAAASKMSLRLQTLPSIKETLPRADLPISSGLLGCSLEETVLSFNSIVSSDSEHIDFSWLHLLTSMDATMFSESREDVQENKQPRSRDPSTSEISPETDVFDEIMNQTMSDVMSSAEDVFEETPVDVNDTVMTMFGRKDAGQKKEKVKSNSIPSFYRRTVPIIENDDHDHDSPFRLHAAPFDLTILPSHDIQAEDEVSSRDDSCRHRMKQRAKLDAQYVEPCDVSSTGSSFKKHLRWLSAQASSSTSIRRKKASAVSLDDTIKQSRMESIRKAAGVRDGSKRHRSKSERWIRC